MSSKPAHACQPCRSHGNAHLLVIALHQPQQQSAALRSCAAVAGAWACQGSRLGTNTAVRLPRLARRRLCLHACASAPSSAHACALWTARSLHH